MQTLKDIHKPSLPHRPANRIYVRGLVIQKAEILTEWAKLSDHLAIYAELGH